MIGKTVKNIFNICFSLTLAGFIGCSKQETKQNKAKFSGNLVKKPDMETGVVFNSGVYLRGRYSITKPQNWTTKNQLLNDFTGWASDEAHSGQRSLKIENPGCLKNTCWRGAPAWLKHPARNFEFSFWTKAKKIKKNDPQGRFGLKVEIVCRKKDKKTGNMIQYGNSVFIDISSSDHDWKKTVKKYIFRSDIIKIVPICIFSQQTGTVWFDDIDIRAVHCPSTFKK